MLFVVDIDVVNFEDLKADDMGLWKETGTKKCISEFCRRALSSIQESNNYKSYI